MRRMYSKPQLLEAVEQEAEVNGLKVFENIVDKDGHKRFIEWDGVNETLSGIEITYSKASLSGTHLMFVLVFNAENNATLGNTKISEFTLPQWLADKIFPLWTSIVNYITFNARDSGGGTQTIQIALRKDENKIQFYSLSSQTFTAARVVRAEFDLLIDNE